MKKKWKLYSMLAGSALVVAALGVWLFGGTAVASAEERTVNDLQTLTQSTAGPGLFGDGYLAHGGWGGRGGFKFPPLGNGTIDYQQLLADALGINVDDLQAAYAGARTAAIEQAVEEGLITREQADEMLVWGGLGRKDFWGFGGPMRRGSKGISGSAIDENALLADALGITVDELDAARASANQAAIDQALEEGLITQEQVDQMRARQEQMQARRDLQSYLDRDTLLAQALGMTVEELQAAFSEDKSLSTLMSEKGLDAATVRDNLQAAYQGAIAQAVEDGVITQEQADAIKDGMGRGLGPLSHSGPGFGREGVPLPEGFRGHEGFRGRGGFGDRGPWNPDNDDSGGTGLRRPGRTVPDASTL
jgi:hypothetical protein